MRCSYRYDGLRPSDFKRLLASLQEQLQAEPGRPYRERKAGRTWAHWVGAAGARVRGNSAVVAAVVADGVEGEADAEPFMVWPLQLVDRAMNSSSPQSRIALHCCLL